MAEVFWKCPHCEETLHCDRKQKDDLLICPSCGGASRPSDCAEVPSASVRSTDPTRKRRKRQRRAERDVRQMMREFRKAIGHLFESELKQLFALLHAGKIPDIEAFSELFLDEVESELERRLDESAWDKTKRAAFRASTAVKDWLKTDQGKAAGVAAGVVALLLGYQLFDD